MDSPERVRRRLIALRRELGYGDRKQSAFADDLGLAKNVYNPFEQKNNKRGLTLDAACRIRQRFGVPLDWLFLGEMAVVSHPVVMKLGPDPKIEEDGLPRAPAARRKA